MFQELPLSIESSSRVRAGLVAILLHLTIIIVAVCSTRGTAEPKSQPIFDAVRIELPPAPTMQSVPRIAPRGQFPVVPSAPEVAPLRLESPPSANFKIQSKLDRGLADVRTMISNDPSGRDSSLLVDTAVVPASAADHLPELLGDLNPHYPDELRRTGVSGEAVLEYVINREGRVVAGSIRVIRTTHPAFARSAIESLLHARFNPARRAGWSVAVVVRQRIRFESRQSL